MKIKEQKENRSRKQRMSSCWRSVYIFHHQQLQVVTWHTLCAMLAWKYLIFHCYFFKCWESETTAVPLPFQVTVAAHYVSVVCFQITGVETNKHKQFYVYHDNKLKCCFFLSTGRGSSIIPWTTTETNCYIMTCFPS